MCIGSCDLSTERHYPGILYTQDLVPCHPWNPRTHWCKWHNLRRLKPKFSCRTKSSCSCPVHQIPVMWSGSVCAYGLSLPGLERNTTHVLLSSNIDCYLCLTVSMLLTTVLLMYIYTACWLNNYVVQLCPFWCNTYGARLSRLLTLTSPLSDLCFYLNHSPWVPWDIVSLGALKFENTWVQEAQPL